MRPGSFFLHFWTFLYLWVWKIQTCHTHSELGSHLDDNVSFSGACAVKLTVFLHHHNLTLLFHLLHVFLHLVKDTAVILLCYANKLTERKREQKWASRHKPRGESKSLLKCSSIFKLFPHHNYSSALKQRQDFIIAKFSLITPIILMLNEWAGPYHFCTKWDISRVSTAGPKADMLVRARANRVSTVTSGAWSCLVGASLGPTARVFWPAENLGPKRANSGLRSGYEQRRSFSASGERQHHGLLHIVNR